MIKVFKFSFFLFLLSRCLFGWGNNHWKYCITVEVQDTYLKEFVNIAYVKFPIKGKIEETEKDIKILDEEEKPVLFTGKINRQKKECEIFFQTTNSGLYKIYYGNKTSQKENKKLSFKKTGTLLIDDFVSPNDKTSGLWIWRENPVISGKFSHTEPEGSLFHSISFSKSFKFGPAEKLIQYLFLDSKKSPEEIMIGIQSRRKKVFFSWGKDIIKWKNLKKTEMGELPAKGKWERIEIPLSQIGQRELTGISFYHSEGKVFWDRTSTGEIPLKAIIKKFEILSKSPVAYFTYAPPYPFKFKGQKLYFLKLNSSASCDANSCEWEIEGKVYKGKFVEISIPAKKMTKILLKVQNKEGEEDKFKKEIFFPENSCEELKFAFKLLPYKNFVYEGEEINISFQVTNLSNEVLKLDMYFNSEERKFQLLPGKTNSKLIYFKIPVEFRKDEKTAKLYLGKKLLSEKKICLTPDSIDFLKDDGPYLKNRNGNYLIFLIPEYGFEEKKSLQIKKDTIHIAIIGDFPYKFTKKLEKSLHGKNMKSEFTKYTLPSQHSYNILSDFSWLYNNRIEKKYDIFLFFPSLSTLWRRPPEEDWKRSIDGMTYLLLNCSKKVILISPFPSAPEPELFKIYTTVSKKLSEKRNIPFINLYKLYLSIPSWEKFFKIRKKIYQNLPNDKGTDLLVKLIIEKIEKLME